MAQIVTITNPLTGQPAQVDQLEHTAQQIDDAVKRALEYGLGGGTTIPEPNDANTCLNTGWYAISSMANCPFSYGILRAEKWYGNAIWQTAYQLGTGVIARRQYKGGSTWTVWEYGNPPLTTNNEYPTTERYNGKIVYARAVSVGDLAANTETVATALGSGGDTCVRANAYGTYNSTHRLTTPFNASWCSFTASGLMYKNGSGNQDIRAYVLSTKALTDVVVVLYYTKV